MVVGLEEQYHQQELNLKEHQAEITNLKLQLRNLEAMRGAELKAKDKEIEHKSQTVGDYHKQILKLETERDALRKDAQEALDLAEGKGWTVKVGEPEKGPLFKAISNMLVGAEECQKERILLKSQLGIAANTIRDLYEAVSKAGFEIVNGTLVRTKKHIHRKAKR